MGAFRSIFPSMPNAPQRRGILRRIAIGVGVAVALVVVLLVAAVLLIDSKAVTSRVVDAILPRASAALGRDVTIRSTALSIFPSPRVRLAGFAVAGRPGEPALVEADGLDVSVALWPLLRSLGRRIEVEGVTLERPTVNVVRGRDGRWNFEGLGGAKEQPGAPGAPAPRRETPPPAPERKGGGAQVIVRRVSIRDGAIRMIDRATGRGEASVALDRIAFDASGLGAGLPAAVHLSAALASDQPNLDLSVSVASLPSGVPARPEDWPIVQGSLAVGPLALDRVSSLLPAGTSAVVRGGTVSLNARLATAGGAYQLEGQGGVKDLRLRGQPASASFHAAGTFPPAQPAAARVELSQVQVNGPGVDLGGTAAVELAPLRARFVVTGPLLDLDAVMGALPPSPPKPKAATPAGGPLLPPGLRHQVQAASAAGTLDVGTLRSGKLQATNVHAVVRLAGGVLDLEALDAALYGGQLHAGGTRVDLGAAEPRWTLQAKLAGVDVASAMQGVSGASPVSGKASATLALQGDGIDWAKLRRQLTGAADVGLANGALSGADVGGAALGAVAKGLAAVGQGKAATRLTGKTDLRDLAASFGIEDGWMKAKRPLAFDTPTGRVELGGRIGLDEALDLQGTIAIPRAVLADVAPKAVRLPETLAVPVVLGGTLGAPSVQVRADEAVATLLKQQAGAARKAVQQELEKRAGKSVGDLLKRLGR